MLKHNFNKRQKINQNKINIDEIDDLKNKRIRTIGEILQVQTKTAVSNLAKRIKSKLYFIDGNIRKIKSKKILEDLTENYQISNYLKSFFNQNALSQSLKNINPLTEISQKRKITLMGDDAMKQGQMNLKARGINISQYSRLCPIETTEGKNSGLILFLTKVSTINRFGFLLTPLFLRKIA